MGLTDVFQYIVTPLPLYLLLTLVLSVGIIETLVAITES